MQVKLSEDCQILETRAQPELFNAPTPKFKGSTTSSNARNGKAPRSNAAFQTHTTRF